MTSPPSGEAYGSGSNSYLDSGSGSNLHTGEAESKSTMVHGPQHRFLYLFYYHALLKKSVSSYNIASTEGFLARHQSLPECLIPPAVLASTGVAPGLRLIDTSCGIRLGYVGSHHRTTTALPKDFLHVTRACMSALSRQQCWHQPGSPPASASSTRRAA